MIGVSTLLLSAVCSTRWKTSITLATNCLITVVALSQESQRGIIYTASETQDKVQRRLLLDIIIRQCASIFELFSSEDQTLLVRWDSFLILNFGLHIIDCIRWLDIKRDGLTCKSNRRQQDTTWSDNREGELLQNTRGFRNNLCFELVQYDR